MIEWFIGVVIGLAIGLTIGILLQKSKLVGRLQALEGEAAGLRRQMEGERSAAAKQVTQIREDASRQMRQLTDRDEALLANERNLHDREMETVRSAHAKQIASLESQIAEERRHATELREENNRQWGAASRHAPRGDAEECGRTVGCQTTIPTGGQPPADG